MENSYKTIIEINKAICDEQVVELGQVSTLTLGIGKWFTESLRHFGKHF